MKPPSYSDPPPGYGGDDFGRYAYYILAELTEGKRERKALRNDIQALALQITAMRARASVWGSIAGVLGGLSITAIEIIVRVLQN